MFSLELLQAINEWQQGYSTKKRKTRLGQKIKYLAKGIDDKFRSCDLCCFRQISLDKKSVWEIIAEDRLEEMVSSWTIDLSVAKDFKGGVPPEGWQGAIFILKPDSSQVILNLDRLYRAPEFRDAIEAHKDGILGFDLGIGKYGNKQAEVIIEIESLDAVNLYALGGYSSNRENFLSRLLGRLPTENELAVFDFDLACIGKSLGPAWVEGDVVTRIRQKMQPKIERLRYIKSIQEKTG